MDESSQPTAKVFTLEERSEKRLILPIGHELDCRDTTLVLFKDPYARILHPNVPDTRGRIVGTSCKNVAV